MSNQEIAKELVISQNTVKVHLRNIFVKLDAASRTDAVVKAAQAGWVEVGGLEEQVGEAPLTIDRFRRSLRWPDGNGCTSFWPQRWSWPHCSCQGYYRLEARAPVSDLSDVGLPRLGVPVRVDVARWSNLAPLPQPRSRLALAAVDDLLIAIGGEGPDGVVDAVDVYDPETNGWLPRSVKPLPVANVQAAVIDRMIYVPGGTTATGEVSSELEVYDFVKDDWSARSLCLHRVPAMDWQHTTASCIFLAAGTARPTSTRCWSMTRPPTHGKRVPRYQAVQVLVPQLRLASAFWWWRLRWRQ